MHLRYTEKPFDYFLIKFQRRLYRQLIQYETLTRYLPETIQAQSGKIAKILGIGETALNNIELKDHAEKSCLIGLKAEFELFFYIFCIFILNKILSDAEESGKLSDEHEGVVRCVANVKEYYEEFVKGGFRNPKELFTMKAIPDYGLDRMVRFLETCGLSMQKALRTLPSTSLAEMLGENILDNLRAFSQVRVAFQVRHAIEHSFSRIGEGFIYKTTHDWKHSSWYRQFATSQGPRLGERILVDSLDINATAAAMGLVATALERIWRQFCSEGLAGLRGKDGLV